MHTLLVRNVNEAFIKGLTYLRDSGTIRDSRNGKVLVSPFPVCTTYQNPRERVLFNPLRDCNHFFHFFEALWMLAGRQDVAFPSFFTKNIAQFSDDGIKFNGAYGYRWRHHFNDNDQLEFVINELQNNHDSRRAVIAMWDPFRDIDAIKESSKDVPCNTQIYFSVFTGRLHMTLCNRSNDVVWGAYGANAVHFSILHEYIAGAIGVPVGRFYQISNNYHVYMDRPDVQRLFAAHRFGKHESQHSLQYPASPYHFFPFREEEDRIRFDDELINMLEEIDDGVEKLDYCTSPLLQGVAAPMYYAYRAYKVRDFSSALEYISRCDAVDWRIACTEWLERRAHK